MIGNPDVRPALQIRNHRYEIAKVEYQTGSGWKALPRESYNYFLDANGMGPGPYTIRVTDVNGQVVEDAGIVLTPAATVSGQGQFAVCP